MYSKSSTLTHSQLEIKYSRSSTRNLILEVKYSKSSTLTHSQLEIKYSKFNAQSQVPATGVDAWPSFGRGSDTGGKLNNTLRRRQEA